MPGILSLDGGFVTEGDRYILTGTADGWTLPLLCKPTRLCQFSLGTRASVEARDNFARGWMKLLQFLSGKKAGPHPAWSRLQSLALPGSRQEYPEPDGVAQLGSATRLCRRAGKQELPSAPALAKLVL